MLDFRAKKESARRDSNPRPSPWQGDAPPLSHSRLLYLFALLFPANKVNDTIPVLFCQHEISDFPHFAGIRNSGPGFFRGRHGRKESCLPLLLSCRTESEASIFFHTGTMASASCALPEESLLLYTDGLPAGSFSKRSRDDAVSPVVSKVVPVKPDG